MKRLTLQFDVPDEVQLISATLEPIAVPPPLYAGTPFGGTPIAIPATWEAEDFDVGGEGVAYHDNVPGNAGGQYRSTEDVDIVADAGGYVVNNFETGEWLNYTINVLASALYDIELLVSTTFSNSAFHVEVDGKDVTGSITVPGTGGWGTFQWVGKQGVSLAAGRHVLKIASDQQYFNLNSVRVTAAESLPLPAPSPTTVLWSADMEEGNMTDWYRDGGGGEFNGHPGSEAGPIGSDGSRSEASRDQFFSGSWSAKLSIPTSGASRLVRWKEPSENAVLDYSAKYFIPRFHTVGPYPNFWMLQQWKSTAGGKHDPFFMLTVLSPGAGPMKLRLVWFPVSIDGPLPGQTGTREWLSNFDIPVGRWFEVRTRYKSAGDFTGSIQLWLDGMPSLQFFNVRTRYPEGPQMHWSITSYAQDLQPAPAVIYVDNVSISRP